MRERKKTKMTVKDLLEGKTNEERKQILDTINTVSKAYMRQVSSMPDKTLYEHCFDGSEISEGDFAKKEFNRRGLRVEDYQ